MFTQQESSSSTPWAGKEETENVLGAVPGAWARLSWCSGWSRAGSGPGEHTGGKKSVLNALLKVLVHSSSRRKEIKAVWNTGRALLFCKHLAFLFSSLTNSVTPAQKLLCSCRPHTPLKAPSTNPTASSNQQEGDLPQIQFEYSSPKPSNPIPTPQCQTTVTQFSCSVWRHKSLSAVQWKMLFFGGNNKNFC